MGVILDTTEFINAEKLKLPLAHAFELYPYEEQFSMSILTIAELQHGIRRAETVKQLQRRQQVLDDALAICRVEPLTFEVAIRAGTLDAELAMKGQRTDLADLIIAATALELGYSVVTSNLDDFERVPGLVIVPSPLKTNS